MGSVVDRLRRLWWTVCDRARESWGAFADQSRKAKILTIGGVVLVVAVIAGLAVSLTDDASQEQQTKLAGAVVTTGDLPATLWSGWSERTRDSRPAPAVHEETKTTPDECAPGGDLQRSVQTLALDGGAWAGTVFTNIGLQARAETMLASNSRNVADPVDKWVAACGSATVGATHGGMEVTMKQLPVKPSVYHLASARVFSQTVTPRVANAEAATTTLTAVGSTGEGHVVYVTLTFPGAVTNDAIGTLDTLWRAQAAKLVAYQRSGKL